jgi:hypothetical protein
MPGLVRRHGNAVSSEYYARGTTRVVLSPLGRPQTADRTNRSCGCGVPQCWMGLDVLCPSILTRTGFREPIVIDEHSGLPLVVTMGRTTFTRPDAVHTQVGPDGVVWVANHASYSPVAVTIDVMWPSGPDPSSRPLGRVGTYQLEKPQPVVRRQPSGRARRRDRTVRPMFKLLPDARIEWRDVARRLRPPYCSKRQAGLACTSAAPV